MRWGPNPQIELLENDEGVKFLRYTEDVSKSNRGGLKHKKVQAKSVDAFENPNKERCVVRCYETYLSHVPEKKPLNAFYLRPLVKPQGKVWFCSSAYGRTKLSNSVSTICKLAGIPGFRTNHSLRATSATRLFESNVDEQRICEITGHRSNAVRSYKRTSEHMKMHASSIIQGCNIDVNPSKKRLCSTPKTPSCTVSKNPDTQSDSVVSDTECISPEQDILHPDSVSCKIAPNNNVADETSHDDSHVKYNTRSRKVKEQPETQNLNVTINTFENMSGKTVTINLNFHL